MQPQGGKDERKADSAPCGCFHPGHRHHNSSPHLPEEIKNLYQDTVRTQEKFTPAQGLYQHHLAPPLLSLLIFFISASTRLEEHWKAGWHSGQGYQLWSQSDQGRAQLCPPS